MSSIIEIQNLTRRFGDTTALQDVSFEVPAGVVLGLVGRNGAGKTTLIKHLMGFLRPQSGSVRVFGLDPVAQPDAVLGRIGYVSEERDLPAWMRIGELLRYSQAFYPAWDMDLAFELCDQFQLDLNQKVGSLSRGQSVRAALVLALSPRPELLVLDEPSSGLDPVVRRDILGAILETVAQEGRTILFSSHLLDEVERMSDRLMILEQGRVVVAGELEEVRASGVSLENLFLEKTAST
jgi:ABC-2 type transport system ATP-binding protein